MSTPQAVKDGIPMKGTLCVVVRDAATAEVKRRIEIRNKITYLAADVLVELIAQRAVDPSAGTSAIYSMRIGSSNTPAARSDTNLGSFVIGKQLTDVDKISGAPGEITFVSTIASGDANGSTLREAGLFTGGPVPSVSDTPGTSGTSSRMIARQIYPDVIKTAAIVIDFSWTIAFTATP